MTDDYKKGTGFIVAAILVSTSAILFALHSPISGWIFEIYAAYIIWKL